ncbi:MAG: hypothetical protein WDA29_10935 [Flavobacteriaceae bacterium]
MGILDNKEHAQKIKSLERTTEKLFNIQNTLADRIKQLGNDLIEATKSSPEYEKEAKEASRRTSEFKNKAYQTLEEAKEFLASIESHNSIIENNKIVSGELIEKIKSDFESFNNENNSALENLNALNERIEQLNETISTFENTIENHPDLESEIIELETSITKIKENESKSSQLIKSITNRKIELQTLYNEILGYEEEDDEGNITKVNGSKQELLESLDGLEERVSDYKVEFDELEKNTSDRTTNLLKVNSEKISEQINGWEDKYEKLNKKIESLLPNAVTAGLSHAFSKKKEDEDKSYEKHKKQFGYGIAGMIAVSLIPFLISVFTLFGNDSLDVIINRAPKLVIAILPLYIPVLWLSISSSKKMNLSKRLIEEYAHKEVLSKTFEGLSRQIHDLEEDNISKELKLKLLQDFLQMYSENPGKLISDYNKSDHPIMELLENSNKLDKTILKVQKFPGLNKVAEIIEKKSERKFNQVADGIERTIDKKLAISEENEENENEQTV